MRLINVESLEIHEFYDTNIPAYAILSHTWGSEEVTLQEFILTSQEYLTQVEPTNFCHRREGFTKIIQSCHQARKDGFQYIWVDTCCIDKTSSAELSEAINSMFQWYENSDVCYAYLNDVPATSVGNAATLRNNLFSSRWFCRGWTLQELLAPAKLIFFAADWSTISTRTALAAEVSEITGIDRYYLSFEPGNIHVADEARGEPNSDSQLWKSLQVVRLSNNPRPAHLRRLYRASHAERMSWAAKRQTTRIEDVAYSLLGIFDVKMPLIYGEGSKAFIRLQEEVLRQSSDYTILAWRIFHNGKPVRFFKAPTYGLRSFVHPWSRRFLGIDRYSDDCPSVGLLAESPAAFLGCQDIIPYEVGDSGVLSSLTNRGISVNLPISDDKNPHILLPCRLRNDPWHFISIPLIRHNNNTFARAQWPPRLFEHDTWLLWQHTTVNLLLRSEAYAKESPISPYSFWIRNLPEGFDIADTFPQELWFPNTRTLELSKDFAAQPIGSTNTIYLILHHQHTGRNYIVALHVRKLFEKGIAMFRPVRVNYKIIPRTDFRTPQQLSTINLEDIPSKPFCYELVDGGVLYLHIRLQSLFGKPIFVTDIYHEKSEYVINWLQIIFDMSVIVSAQVEDWLSKLRFASRIMNYMADILVRNWEGAVRLVGFLIEMTVIFFLGLYYGLGAPWGWLISPFSIYHAIPVVSIFFPSWTPFLRKYRRWITAVPVVISFLLIMRVITSAT